ncbi:ATP synthase F0 sector subunit 4 [Spathaspora passalidarum NRRL Y-27907]|uniref:ATP synthase subunit 4 n=1 Tax=Spathaspora passalidarum (strain NRRL Y-27907 / 11-Y1) TaxID=619300 RepID=G3AL19_SPAPN|nr:ATP synthase F0 sector subunit 4 [Spathaspora passalidarum NRRL Y-27907]EGW33061.1 ATP synthase F0 sector subunit 4 [Spathaspora passalidarum NRRL Y-27907]
MSMINRIALRAARPMGLRMAPYVLIGLRFASTQPVEPKQKAASIIDALPGNNLLSKTGVLATSTAAAVYGISNGLIVIHDETILLGTFSAFVLLCVKYIAPLYTEWADGEIKKVGDILNASRVKHVESVNDRIATVSQLKNVVETTQDLFALSKETAKLEADAFVLKQQLAVAHEAKSVLDSWVRFEAQQRQLEQEQLAKSVIEKVNKAIEDPKFQDKVLAESLAEVERLFAKN